MMMCRGGKACCGLLFIVYLSVAKTAYADDVEKRFIEWQSVNVQYLKGNDYVPGEPNRQIITVEYANQWSYGDLFVFIDAGRIKGGEKTAYGEISPRISMNRLTGHDIDWWVLKDIFISLNYEQAEQSQRTYLYGLGADFTVPGFKFFKTNFYIRDKPNIPGKGWQFTLVWNSQFQIASNQWLAEGFADIAGDEGEIYHANQLIVPRLLMDVSHWFNLSPERLWLGMEYSYWKNKFGIEGLTEKNPQLQLKWVF